MRHARGEALDRLEPLLAALRTFPALRERSRGVFYRSGQAYLHFHEDPAGLFADLRQVGGADFDRFDVTSESGRDDLLAAVRARLG